MRGTCLALAAALLLLSGEAAHALYMRWGKGDPAHPISASFWPKGATELANRSDRFDGYMINASDKFYYAGDAKAFNNFLEGYAKVTGSSLELILVDAKTGALDSPKLNGAAWEMSISSNGHAGVTFPVDGAIKLQDVHVPLNVDVQAYPDAGSEIQAFIAAHEAAQKKAREK